MSSTAARVATIVAATLTFTCSNAAAQEIPTALFVTAGVESHAGTALEGSSPPELSDRKFTFFHRLRPSPAGTHFGFLSFTDTGSQDTDEVVVIVGTSSSQSVIVEGVTALGDGSGETIGAFDAKLGVNDAGCYAVRGDAKPGTDDVIAKGCDGNPLEVMARVGMMVPGIDGRTFIGFAREPQIDNDDVVWFGMDTSESPNNRSIFMSSDGTDTVRVVQEGVTVFGGQAGGATEAFESLDNEFSQAAGGLRVSGDGEHLLIRGDLFGDTAGDDVLVVDGTVVVQEGAALAGFASPVAANGPTAAYLAGNGDWFARGGNTDGTTWVVRNGAVLAETGDETVAGSGEHFTSFSLVAPGLTDDYVIGGTTDLADQAALVYYPGSNGGDPRVVLRQLDGVDLDGDGQVTGSDARISAFDADGAAVLAAEMLAAKVTLCADPCAGFEDNIGSAIIQASLAAAPAGVCGDPVDPPASTLPASRHPRVVTASDALFTLRTAVGSESCELCVCDVNDSGSVTASDALLTLQSGVGQAVELTCPPCT